MPQRRTSRSTCPFAGRGASRSTTSSCPSLQLTALTRAPPCPSRRSYRERVVVQIEASAAPGGLERQTGAKRGVAVLVEVVTVGVRAGALEEDLVMPAP